MCVRGLVIATVLVIALTPAVAYAKRVHSYAYVTATHGYCGAGTTCDNHHCKITALLPQKVVEHRPTGAPKDLLAGATVVSERLSDDELQCDGILHTWIDARFDTSDREDVDLSFPDPGLTFNTVLAALFAVALGWLIWRQRRRKGGAHSAKQAA